MPKDCEPLGAGAATHDYIQASRRCSSKFGPAAREMGSEREALGGKDTLFADEEMKTGLRSALPHPMSAPTNGRLCAA